MLAECEKLIVVRLDAPKLAVPVGTAPGLQFAPVFQSPDAGLAPHVASWARAVHGSSVAASSNVQTVTIAVEPVSVRARRARSAPVDTPSCVLSCLETRIPNSHSCIPPPRR